MRERRMFGWTVRAGRMLVAVPFATGAWHAWNHPAPLPGFARSAGLPFPEALTKAAAGTMLVGAAAVGTSFAPVLGGVLLAGSLVGTTAIVHPFWNDEDPTKRSLHRKAFIANCGLLGGVLVTTVHAHGQPRTH
jgi:putative oxidoreductase